VSNFARQMKQVQYDVWHWRWAFAVATAKQTKYNCC
jgi:LAS superfamily LD-carboxypeptidase LdcB